MKKQIYLPIFLFLLILGACTSEDVQLEKSIFIEDVNNPGLPIYSEWGYNTFGAYIDRKVFISNDFDLPAKIIVNSDTLTLILKGTLKSEMATLKFTLIGYSPADYPDLVSFNNSTIDLTSDKCIITLTTYSKTLALDVFDGKIFFKRVQNLYVDKEQTESILSGTFNFKTFIDGEPIAVSNGRFDLGIGYGNFYNY